MDSSIDLLDPSKALDLANIRIQLIRLEDTITYHLIERVQFPLNRTIYEAGAVKIPDSTLSFFDWFLWQTERLHSLVRRYQSPDEYPFFPEALENPLLQPLQYPEILHPNTVNLNKQLKVSYVDHILPQTCHGGSTVDRGASQEHYGSCATQDVAALQALSRRIHFGKFVAESKYRQSPAKYQTMIRKADRAAITEAITDTAVEARVLDRLRLKAIAFGTDPSTGDEGLVKIDADAVVAMYKDYVIPLTKEVEIEYLMQRLIG